MEAEIVSLYQNLIDAWNRRDAEGMAALYAEQGSQVGFDGSAIDGRSAIAGHLAPIFRDHPTAAFVTIIREVRAIGPDTALLRAVAGMVPPGSCRVHPDRNAIQTMVAARHQRQWQVEMFQNTPARFDGRPQEAERLTAELQAALDQKG